MSNVLTATDGPVRTITMNRPEARNALDSAAYRALIAALADAGRDPAVRAVVFAGAGGHFTAGNDIKDFQGEIPEGDVPGIAFLKDLARFPKPMLAAVEGVAVGIGSTMLLHCDFAYAGRGARFRMPFVPLGLCPEGGSTVLLARVVGPKKAWDWLLTGREFTGAEAAEAGFVTAATDDGGALRKAQETAQALAQLPPESIRVTKGLLRRAELPGVLEALDVEMVEFKKRRASPEAQAIFAAFFARRGK